MAEPGLVREVPTALRVMMTPASSDGDAAIACLNCRKPLDMHQPDPDFPDRMLATCRACQSWHLIDFKPGMDEALLVLLPQIALLRRALRSPRSVVSTPGIPEP